MIISPRQQAEMNRILSGRIPPNIFAIMEIHNPGHTEIIKGLYGDPLGSVELDGERDCQLVLEDSGVEEGQLAVQALTFKI